MTVFITLQQFSEKMTFTSAVVPFIFHRILAAVIRISWRIAWLATDPCKNIQMTFKESCANELKPKTAVSASECLYIIILKLNCCQ